jgi:hypothetical protein
MGPTQCAAMSPDRNTLTAHVFGPIASEEDLLVRALKGFGVISREGAARRTSASVEELADALRRFLVGLRPLNAHPVLKIDTVADAPPTALERIRMLSALEADGRPLLEVIAGETEPTDLVVTPWFRVPLRAAIAVALVAAFLAAAFTAVVYDRFGF